MGEATGRVDAGGPQRLEHEVELIREHLSEVVSELDYRRHELMDFRAQLQKHKGAIAAVICGVVLVTGGAIAVGAWRARRARTVAARLERLKLAFRNASRDNLVRQESIGHKVAAAVLATLASTVIKQLARGSLERAPHAA
jgi:hypothetical protein